MGIPFITTHDAVVGEPVEVAPGVVRVLADNPGPFTFTGTQAFVLGEGPTCAVLDPGPDSPSHRDALLRAIGDRTVSHILVTHHHLDHTAAVPWLQEVTGAETCGYGSPRCHQDEGGEDVPEGPSPQARMEAGDDPRFRPDRLLRDGDTIETEAFRIEALHTPGHTSNHLCFAYRNELFCGDHVMGWSTSVVTPPDGHMGSYMRELRRIRDRDFHTLRPTHGEPIVNPRAFLDAYLAHREAREAGVLAAVRSGVSDIPAIVARLYPALDPRLLPAASLNVLAPLVTLREHGRVTGDRDDSLLCRYTPA